MSVIIYNPFSVIIFVGCLSTISKLGTLMLLAIMFITAIMVGDDGLMRMIVCWCMLLRIIGLFVFVVL